jgi:thiol-disulfide isomerase/thioredoxin
MTDRTRRRWLAAATAWAATPALGQVDEARAPALPAVGTALALPPSIERLDGSQFDAARDAAGQVLVLYWWASWCPFCALVSPHIEALWREQRGKGLRLLAPTIDREPQAARDYLARRGYTFPAAGVTPAFQHALPKPRGLPITLVRGRDGRVLQAEAGQIFAEDVMALARHV